MPDTLTIQDVKSRHEELYDLALREAPSLRRALATGVRTGVGARGEKPGSGQAFLGEVNELLANLTNLSSRVSSFEDYRWLSHTAVKWQNVFAFLDVPTFVKLDPPTDHLLPPAGAAPPATPDAALTGQELDHWIKTHAELFAYTRIAKLRRFSTPDEIDHDRHLAFVYLASDILDGKISLVRRIAPRSYWHLERVWMEDLKHLRAYLLWLERGGGFGLSQMERNYLDVCDHLRWMLTNPEIKASKAEFEPVRRHLVDDYLSLGKIDPDRSEQARWLIGDKAYRIYIKTGRAHTDENWFDSETYVKLFYENIIPAALDHDYESTLAVLRAFQCHRSDRRSPYLIINAFEASLATYFLSPEQVRKVWDSCKSDEPAIHAAIISEVEVLQWPKGYKVPTICGGRFEVGDRVIRFKGVMSDAQRDALVAPLSGDQARAVEALYRRSRMARRQSTL